MALSTRLHGRLTYWLGMAVMHLLFLLLNNLQNLEGTPIPPAGGGKVQLTQIDERHISLCNGIASITLNVPNGEICSVSYKGGDNLLNAEMGERDRGYWNVAWNLGPNGADTIDMLQGTSYKVIVENENQVEVSFSKVWESGDGKCVPLSFDKRFVMLKDSPGFYSYSIFERQPGWPDYSIQEGRLVFKLNQEKFHYMAMSDVRQREMPTYDDRMKQSKVLDFKEAVQLINPSNPAFKGEVDDKYFYACNNKDGLVHGWVSNDVAPVGFWMITPSNEFRTGGPLKQDLTSHCGPNVLAMFISRHYVGEEIDLKFKKDEPWKKVIGPLFIYLNSDPKAKENPYILWEDAKQRMKTETESWPYNFPISKDFLKPPERGSVSGKLLVHDRSSNKPAAPATSAFVGLACPGPVGSWQLEGKGYQFWTPTDATGNFVIKNVIPGDYSLFAFVHGTIGEYKHPTDITITPGKEVAVGDVVFEPPKCGPTLWEIGIPDRTANEFFVPNPAPEFKVHVYAGNAIQRFQQYGLWDRFNDFCPKGDLVFTVGTSDYRKDWFYAHLARQTSPGKYEATKWHVEFDLPTVDKGANYTLQIAIAAATHANLKVNINDPKSRPHFMTGDIGQDSAIPRYGDHGIYRLHSFGVKGSLFEVGKNTIIFTASSGKMTGVMYDYICLEGPGGGVAPGAGAALASGAEAASTSGATAGAGAGGGEL